MRCVLIVVLLLLAGCGSVPDNTRNACAVFEQRDGLFNNWRRAAYRAEREYGVPVPVLMATVYAESGFRHNAKPPRRKLLGFIPWKRVSSAYGYAQALDGTWEQYQREAGGFGSRRANFADAVDFVGWYHAKTVAKYSVAPNDAYNLYLAYYSGWTGYSRGSWRSNASLQRTARATAEMARDYQSQLARCG